jgi:hypothetical protein
MAQSHSAEGGADTVVVAVDAAVAPVIAAVEAGVGTRPYD